MENENHKVVIQDRVLNGHSIVMDDDKLAIITKDKNREAVATGNNQKKQDCFNQTLNIPQENIVILWKKESLIRDGDGKESNIPLHIKIDKLRTFEPLKVKDNVLNFFKVTPKCQKHILLGINDIFRRAQMVWYLSNASPFRAARIGSVADSDIDV
eukprot:UC4_evm1s1023